MKPTMFGTILAACGLALAFAQSEDQPPKFEAADVHVSAKTQNPFPRTAPVRAGRYEVKTATMVDLIRLAYGIDNDKILEGPSWLEMDHFDVIAKVPADSTPETQKLMLQSLLGERFKLVVHKETRPLPSYVLIAGKKPLLKEASGTEDSGCKPQAQSAGPGPDGGGGMRIVVGAQVAGGSDGAPVRFSLGPGGVIEYTCHNMTMAAFAAGLNSMFGSSLGPNPVKDETGLEGRWNFDIRWSMQMFGLLGTNNPGDHITMFEAVEKQLGLKLEERPVPTPVMVVDKVNEKPSENPPGTAEVLPVIPTPTEFEVASVKPADPNGRGMGFRPQAGGRFTGTGVPLRMLLSQAFMVNNGDQIVGLPAWVDTERFDVVAKAAWDGAATPGVDREVLAPMLRSLLADRFKMTYHTEDRQVSAYVLLAGKPKMKKADPASRTYCKNVPSPPGAPPGSRVLSCQNATMAQFAERLQNFSPELNWPVADATGIEGTWDFSLTFTFNIGMMMPARVGDAGPGGAGPAASDPNGGLTIFEAIEKQLGLKLEKQKRTMPVIVIDHLEQKPTEN